MWVVNIIICYYIKYFFTMQLLRRQETFKNFAQVDGRTVRKGTPAGNRMARRTGIGKLHILAES